MEGVATHLKKFWTPAMRSALVDQVQRGEAPALRDIVAQAVREHHALLRPA